MPVLEITPEMIGEKRSHLALYYISGVMLWPRAQDETRREEWVRAAPVMPIAVIEGRSEQPFIHGFQAGELLATAVQRYVTKGELKLEGLKQDMVSKQRRKAGSFKGYNALDISRSSLENIVWKRYKSASHLWAAFVYAALFNHAEGFPCTLDRIRDFLGLVQFFEHVGVKIPTRGPDRPLLDIESIWRLPPGLELPGFHIDWGSRPPLF
jgi:hypothetical protein